MASRRAIIPEPIKHEVGKDVERSALSIQDAGEATRTFVNRVPLANQGYLFKGTLINGPNKLAHRLGRAPQRWIVTRMIGTFGQIYETSADDRFITLQCSSTPYVEIWFS